MQHLRILAGLYQHRRLFFQPTEGLRPTSHRLRAAVFNILIHRFFTETIGKNPGEQLQGLRVLDGFAGLGSYGLEALSRGAKEVVFLEERLPLCNQIKAFLKQIGSTAAKVLCNTIPAAYIPEKERFHILFLDPPYDAEPSFLAEVLIWAKPHLSNVGVLVLESTHLVTPPSGLTRLYCREEGNANVCFFQHESSVVLGDETTSTIEVQE